jgi:hypothetical protein
MYDEIYRILYYDKNFETLEARFRIFEKRVATIKQQIKILENSYYVYITSLFFKTIKNEKIIFDSDIKVKDFSYALKLDNFGFNKFLFKLEN